MASQFPWKLLLWKPTLSTFSDGIEEFRFTDCEERLTEYKISSNTRTSLSKTNVPNWACCGTYITEQYKTYLHDNSLFFFEVQHMTVDVTFEN